MKTLSLIIMMAIATTAIQANNGDVNDPTARSEKLNKKVSRIIDFPNNMEVPSGSSVSVEIQVQENGQITVTDVSGNPDLAVYVKEKLEKYAVKKVKEIAGEKFYYRFVFKK